MNKLIASLFATALAGSASAFAGVAAPAPTAKDIAIIVDEVNYVETAQKGIILSGYVDAGYNYNFTGSGVAIGRNAADTSAPHRGGDFNLNAFKVALEKPLSDENVLQGGFRADLKFGEDAGSMGSAGIGGLGFGGGNGNNLNIDQAYAIMRAPIGNGLDISVGKFYSLLGYEVDDRPGNLNISYGYDWFFQTTQQTGVKLYYPINDILEVQVAMTNGSGVDTAAGDGYGWTGTLNIMAPGGNANWFHGIYTSSGATDGFSVTGASMPVVYNTWGNWTPKFANDKLLLAFSGTLGDNSDFNNAGASGTFFSGSLYSKYQFTDIFSLAGRMSYYHGAATTNAVFNPALTSTNSDYYSWTLTAGFDLTENLLVRAEYRADFGNENVQGPFGTSDGPSHLASFEVVYSF